LIHATTCASLSSRSQALGRLVCAGSCSNLRRAGRRLTRGGRAIWLRAVRAVPSNADAFVAALSRLTPEVLASLAEAASNDGCRLVTSLDTPVRCGEVTTLHLRWWHDLGASLTPALDGELALRPIGTDSTELTITARYRCHERRRFSDSMFLRRLGESVIRAFADLLICAVDSARAGSPQTQGPFGPIRRRTSEVP